jgi:hypothetical protein
LVHVLRHGAGHDLGLHGYVHVEPEVPEGALLVGELGRDRPTVDVDDPAFGVALVVLLDALDQGRGDVGARALQDEGHVLIGGALERDQRIDGCDLLSKGTSSNFYPTPHPWR